MLLRTIEINNLNIKINDAISDIKTYTQERDLYNEMKRFTEVAENAKDQKTSEFKRCDIFTPTMLLYTGLAAGTHTSALSRQIYGNNRPCLPIQHLLK